MTMKKHEVTVGIPVYNATKFIGRALDAVLDQTFSNMEVLIVDDCSTDDTITLIEQYKERHQRGECIRILQQEKNGGPSAARNRMIDEAHGKYLYFMDVDDTIPVYAIATLYETAIKYHAEVVYGSHQHVEVYDKHSHSELFQYPFRVFQKKGKLASYAYRQYGKFQVPVWNVLINVAFLRETGLRFIAARFWEDMAFTYDLVSYVNRAVLLPDLTYNYICRPNSLSNFQERDVIPRQEIVQNIATIDHIKLGCVELREKTYVGYRSYDVVMNSFYMVCQILKYKNKIQPSFSNEELQMMMYHPLSFHDILHSRRKLFGNLFLWSMSRMPIWLFMITVKVMGKLKRVL